MKFVFGLLCCAAVAYAVLPPDSVDGPPYAVLPPDAVGGPPYARMFKEFKAKYNRVYRNEVENAHRLVVFAENVEYINQHNKEADEGKHTFRLAINNYADLTQEELRQRNNYKVRDNEIAEPQLKTDADPDRPDNLDWTDAGYVNTPQNQGSCGSCWTFAATGAMEGAIFKKTGVLWDLSKQNLVDCETTSYGCEGGFITTALQYGIDEGINLEENYPYTMGEYSSGDDTRGTCSKTGAEYFVSSYDERSISKFDEEALTNYIYSVGPIAVAIDAGNRKFSWYSSGVHYDSSCGSKPRDLNHAVLAVGYGTDADDGDYYIVKNSWGTDWGDAGFIKMARNKDNNCGIATDCVYTIA